MRIISVFFLFLLVSCYRNEECKPFYIGEFKIDTSIISNPACLNYVRKYNWDTVKLISNANGNYSFETNDERLKECEGEWWTSSDDIEGNCFGHVKQNNLERDIMGMAFDISIQIAGETYSLPFRKIDSLGNFIRPVASPVTKSVRQMEKKDD